MDKLAIVTGASQGIGREVAIRLARLNYNLALYARNLKALEALKAEILKNYPECNITVASLDITDKHQVKKCIDGLMQQHKTIDLLFNCAGIAEVGTSDIDIEVFEQIIQVNLLGAFYMLHVVIPYMKKQKSGYIINLVSKSAKRARSDLGAYAASKFGLDGLNESLYKELADYNIKVTALNPGAVDTTMNKLPIAGHEKIQTEDIADTVEFLLKLNANTMIKEINLDAKWQVSALKQEP